MNEILSLASSGLAFFIVAISPGPATLSNATIAMSHGRRPSLIYSLGLSTGLLFWGIVAATGMGAVLQGSLYVLMTLKVLGGLYLLWLAWQSARSALGGESPQRETVGDGDQRWFLRGLILNLSNPKSVIAWMAALSVGLGPNAGLALVVGATAICVCVGFAVNALYSLVFSVSGMMRAYQQARRRINAAVSLLFTAAGVGLIRSAFVD